MQYSKPALTYQQQVQLLQQRGLDISDPALAESYLAQISYYRLSAFFLPFQLQKDIFNPGTTFKQILDLYSFDRELRLLIFDAIERIEIGIRTQMVYLLSHNYGPHWQDNINVFKQTPQQNNATLTQNTFAKTQSIIQAHCTKSNPEVFIKHYKNKYTTPANPPGWMCLELLTIDELSYLYKDLANNSDKSSIAAHFYLHQRVFSSWLHTMVYIRNLCAHHARLWNRELAIKPLALLKTQRPWINTVFNNNTQRIFYFLWLLKYLLSTANPANSFKQKILALFNKYQH